VSRRHLVMDSPIGPLTLVAEHERLACVYMTEHRHAPDGDEFGPAAPADGVLGAAVAQLQQYFDGERTEFDLPLVDDVGTAFQRRVWAELREIPYGETISYAELARRIGQPTAFRAVGLANGRNPISIIVPCHRVVGTGGSLIGYGGGLNRKQLLLNLEGKQLNADVLF
jgi:methylated-DNA-[protein]-cysteine S-methyltransferase